MRVFKVLSKLVFTLTLMNGVGFTVSRAAAESPDDVDQAVVEKQLQDIQEALGATETEELKDFVPSEPLSADAAIDFPSDI